MRRSGEEAKRYDDFYQQYSADVTEAEKEFEAFIKENKEGMNVLFSGPVINFIIAKIDENILYLTQEMVIEKDINQLKILQGQIRGLKAVIGIFKEMDKVRGGNIVNRLLGKLLK